ncbi:MAG: glycosyltransferase family 2 protein [Theionarchaea archaeon]|nr:glycosyltransferase family 2 protein [Theionarchaea archaeon]MBU7036558.1 glycosyltransferase family 2 protein [Theionarchaea archaeon]
MCRVSIVILNWNGWADTIECLESVYRLDYPEYDVIVVDNGSQDESVQKIREYCSGRIHVESPFFQYHGEEPPITIKEYARADIPTAEGNARPGRYLLLIKNEENYGFAEGNNIGIQCALHSCEADYVFLLNNDTVVDPSLLSELINGVKHHEKAGIAGPTLYYYDDPTRTQAAGGIINWWTGKTKERGRGEINGKYDEGEVDYIPGCAFLVKRDVLETVGLLDPVYFAYFEETDFCVRCSKKGFTSVYIPQGKVWHKIARSTGGEFSPHMAYYFVRNRYIFIKRHCEGFKRVTASLFYAGWVARKLTVYTLKGKSSVVTSVLQGVVDAVFGTSKKSLQNI